MSLEGEDTVSTVHGSRWKKPMGRYLDRDRDPDPDLHLDLHLARQELASSILRPEQVRSARRRIRAERQHPPRQHFPPSALASLDIATTSTQTLPPSATTTRRHLIATLFIVVARRVCGPRLSRRPRSRWTTTFGASKGTTLARPQATTPDDGVSRSISGPWPRADSRPSRHVGWIVSHVCQSAHPRLSLDVFLERVWTSPREDRPVDVVPGHG